MAVALAQQAAMRTVSGRLAAILALLWRQVGTGDVVGDWRRQLPEAVGAFTAAQQAAAGMADGFTAAALAAQGATGAPGAASVSPGAFAGRAASGLPLDALLGIPAARARQALAAGMPSRTALAAAGASLQLYARTEVPDAARNAVQVASVAHEVSGYVRVVGALCCGRCAVLSGRWYRTNASFQRHPHCLCIGVPASRTVLEEIPSPQELYRDGRITDLTKAERQALDEGADIFQVVNARRGLYVAGDHTYTTAGTTRRGLAGARILDAQRALAATAKYGPAMRRGLPFTRRTEVGLQQVRLNFVRAPRLSVRTIMQTAGSREEIQKMLYANGYLLREQGAIGSLEQLLRAG